MKTILQWEMPPGGRYSWWGHPGQEIVDLARDQTRQYDSINMGWNRMVPPKGIINRIDVQVPIEAKGFIKVAVVRYPNNSVLGHVSHSGVTGFFQYTDGLVMCNPFSDVPMAINPIPIMEDTREYLEAITSYENRR